MKYLKQFLLIILITFIGEILHYFIPIPIPASIYGLVIMFFLLCTKVIKLENVENSAKFLIEIMPVMFVPAVVKLIVSYNNLMGMLLPSILAITLVTIIVMIVTGKTSDYLLNKRGNKNE